MVIVQQGPLLVMFPSVTHVVVLGQRNKYMEKSDREARRSRERLGNVRKEKNNNRLCKGDKLRNKECIHERGGG